MMVDGSCFSCGDVVITDVIDIEENIWSPRFTSFVVYIQSQTFIVCVYHYVFFICQINFLYNIWTEKNSCVYISHC